MPKNELNEIDQTNEAINRVATVALAAMIYARHFPATKAVGLSVGDAKNAARWSIEAAELFVAEAGSMGYDAHAIQKAVEGAL